MVWEHAASWEGPRILAVDASTGIYAGIFLQEGGQLIFGAQRWSPTAELQQTLFRGLEAMGGSVWLENRSVPVGELGPTLRGSGVAVERTWGASDKRLEFNWTARFDDDSFLPLEVEGYLGGDLRRLGISKVAVALPDFGLPPLPAMLDAETQPWNGRLFPESGTNPLPYSLRQAYDEMKDMDEGFRAFAEEPGVRMCDVTLITEDPSIQQLGDVYRWRIQLCRPDGSRGTLGIFHRELLGSQLEGEFAITPGGVAQGLDFVADELLPLNEVVHAFLKKVGVALPQYMVRINGGGWEWGDMIYEDGPSFSRDAILIEFLPRPNSGLPAIKYSAFDGWLYLVVPGSPAV